MNSITLKIYGVDTKVEFIGNLKDYNDRDLDYLIMGDPGIMNEDVYIDLSTKICYVHDTILGWKEYDGQFPIIYTRDKSSDEEYADWVIDNNRAKHEDSTVNDEEYCQWVVDLLNLDFGDVEAANAGRIPSLHKLYGLKLTNLAKFAAKFEYVMCSDCLLQVENRNGEWHIFEFEYDENDNLTAVKLKDEEAIKYHLYEKTYTINIENKDWMN